MSRRPRTVEEKEARLFERLEAAHEDLQRINNAHQDTRYGCRMAGNCCKVGLQLHWMEIQALARHLEAEFEKDPSRRKKVLARLEEALHDEAWTSTEGIGDQYCSFYANGCTIWPKRPGVCRMYGVILELNDDCPRKRLPSGDAFLYASKDVDALMRRFYRVLDDWGKVHPREDFSIYMPAGLLRALLPKEEWQAIRDRTPKKFWRTEHGYRTQFKPSYRRKPEELTAAATGHPKLRILNSA